MSGLKKNIRILNVFGILTYKFQYREKFGDALVRKTNLFIRGFIKNG